MCRWYYLVMASLPTLLYVSSLCRPGPNNRWLSSRALGFETSSLDTTQSLRHNHLADAVSEVCSGSSVLQITRGHLDQTLELYTASIVFEHVCAVAVCFLVMHDQVFGSCQSPGETPKTANAMQVSADEPGLVQTTIGK